MSQRSEKAGDLVYVTILRNKNYGTDASWVVATHDTTHDVEQEATQEDKLVVFCDEERFRQEMMDF